MGKGDKKNKEPKGGKKRGWVRRIIVGFSKDIIYCCRCLTLLPQLGRGQKAVVQLDQPDPHAPDSLQETYRG